MMILIQPSVPDTPRFHSQFLFPGAGILEKFSSSQVDSWIPGGDLCHISNSQRPASEIIIRTVLTGNIFY
jgi:hypothetical protein